MKRLVWVLPVVLFTIIVAGCFETDGAELRISSDSYVYEPGLLALIDSTGETTGAAVTMEAETETTAEPETIAPSPETAAPDTTEAASKTTDAPVTTEPPPETTVPPAPETSPTETTAAPETTSLPETTAETVERTVYWVASGEVWHLTSGCSTLSRSKNILSGTVEAAMQAGKERVCKRCGS